MDTDSTASLIGPARRQEQCFQGISLTVGSAPLARITRLRGFPEHDHTGPLADDMLPRKWRPPWSDNSFAGEWRQDATHAAFAWNLGRAGVRATLGDCNAPSGAAWKAYAADWRRTGDGRRMTSSPRHGRRAGGCRGRALQTRR